MMQKVQACEQPYTTGTLAVTRLPTSCAGSRSVNSCAAGMSPSCNAKRACVSASARRLPSRCSRKSTIGPGSLGAMNTSTQGKAFFSGVLPRTPTRQPITPTTTFGLRCLIGLIMCR
ncbi:MAG: hypothetical protein KatS3mg052_2001 [Candidatus Roseilinea sp.]|nr:MAG: hypothetical protein KatS3mg052_2001 [Candidatus Roseilinea sp.]